MIRSYDKQKCSQVIGPEKRAPLPHPLVASGPFLRAVSTQLISVGPSKGFVRKHVAPDFIARKRTDFSGNAVMKMNGTLRPLARTRVCSSIPLIVGIRTSVITHAVSCNCGDRRNSSADSNA